MTKQKPCIETPDDEMSEYLTQIQEFNPKLFAKITVSPESAETEGRTCVRWARDPRTGRLICVEWV